MLNRLSADDVRLIVGRGVMTVGRRLENLGHVLQAADGFKLRRLGLSARTVRTLRQATESDGAPPRTVLDIGAHQGEFLAVAAAAFPDARIHCFEPVPRSFAALQDKAREIGGRVQCHPTALGQETGEVAINVNVFTAASSTFDVSPLHKRAFPETAEEPSPRSVPCEQLDVWALRNELERPILLKLDVQGGELDVLGGGERLLSRTASVLVELSFDELYLGAPLAHDVMQFLGDRGFRLTEFLGDLRDRSGRLLQTDAIFVASAARES